ncbi:hypothetical protein AOB60_36970 [Streptomyces noursei]|uniref:LysM domain-containing protein n=2 Tax=Streptomyces noursei TaxID=1971 RepID=A0A2N8P7F6_STRNR|nr:hypothetical protein AOB60_36970 [Streptomyces noursei]
MFTRSRRHLASYRNLTVLVTTIITGLASVVQALPAGSEPNDRWHVVAACESGNRWHTNTGNGYYGGLQISASTWRAFGGTLYAPRADQARRSEQIAVAQRVLRVQGWLAWPTCSQHINATSSDSRGADHSRRLPAAFPSHGHRHTLHACHRSHTSGRCIQHSYTVQKGDTLSSIAVRLNVEGGWPAVYRRNRRSIGDSPHLILPGLRVRLC